MLKEGKYYELEPFRKSAKMINNYHLAKLFRDLFVEQVRFMRMYQGNALVADSEGRKRLCNPEDLK